MEKLNVKDTNIRGRFLVNFVDGTVPYDGNDPMPASVEPYTGPTEPTDWVYVQWDNGWTVVDNVKDLNFYEINAHNEAVVTAIIETRLDETIKREQEKEALFRKSKLGRIKALITGFKIGVSIN